METFELFLFKSVGALSILYVFYWLILRNETFYSWNRLFLLSTLILSFLLPIINFSIQNISTKSLTSVIEPIIINGYLKSTGPIKSVDKLSILSIIYISGAVFFCLRFLSSLAKIHYLYLRFPKFKFNGFKAVVLDSDQTPFTFFNILFISNNVYKSGKIDEMIVHEIAHKENYHSIDIILLEIMTIIQWFNPFVWMFRRSLKSEHEFMADNKVLLEGFDKVRYQNLLVEKSLGITSFDLTNNFNYSLLKKRLKMMTISKSSSLIKIKYLLSIPMLLLTIMLMAINLNSYGQKDKVYTDVDVVAKYRNGGLDGVRQFIQQNINYPKSANVSAKIIVQFVVDENGKVGNAVVIRTDILDNSTNAVLIKDYKSQANPEINAKAVSDIEAEAIRVVNLLSDFTPAQKNGQKVKEQFVFPINFSLGDKK